MKPNVWNINEVLNIPSSSGGTKTGKGPGNNDFSRQTDSQFLLGSQFWPENSQSFSQDMTGQIGGSQKSSQSQEMKKMPVSASYSSKPFLFGDGKIPNFTGNKAVGMLDRFEEEKRNAKEKYERENLTHRILQLQESLESIRETLLNRIEGSNDKTREVLVEKMDNFSKTIEDYLNSVREGITCHFESLQSQTQNGIEDREAKISLAAKDLNSNFLNLQRDLDHLKAEQSKEQGMLGKILSQLGTLTAIHSPTAGRGSVRMIDSEVQTSPGLLEKFMSAEKHESRMLCPFKTPKAQNRNTHVLPVRGQQQLKQTEVRSEYSITSPPANPSFITPIEDPNKEYLDRPLVDFKPEKPLHAGENRQKLSCDALPPPKVLRRRQKALNFRGKKRALVLPQRQSVRQKEALQLSNNSQQNDDLRGLQKDTAPLSSVCDSWLMTNKSVAENHLKSGKLQTTVAPVSMCAAEQPLNPFSMWSQDTNNSQMIVEYKMTKWEKVVPEPEVSVITGEGGLWQLFDFNNDSE
nr:interactor of HORMAD1 protein 1 [Misgurnus anguillicaudatus]